MNLLIALVLFAAPQEAELTQQKVQRLIVLLDADALEERERAAGELVAIGDAALPHLKHAMEGASTPESKARLRSVFERIHFAGGIGELIDAVMTDPWSWYGAPDRPRLGAEARFATAVELKGSESARQAMKQLGGRLAGREPVDPWAAAVDALRKEGAVSCLAVTTLHSNYLTQLKAVRALAELKAWRVAPVVIQAAEALAVDVCGSKSAEVHAFRQSSFAQAIDELLGTSAAWKGDGQNTEALKRAIPVWKAAYEKRLKGEAK
jgi:hypothetical protein